ncbi:MAG: Asp-tRNA(Asn)/Glu-tRNA(Gln) amidotransferase subunit GatB [Candidatus Woesebacteria bacterium]|nr:Asp-tRNA(Asn)/Glu-tRNA(Gln) amidotransferase subunit GatB [Candidatus Woesebacteria bacterium]
MQKYINIIGLEIHIEPNTKSKMFCSCPQDHFGAKPNTQTCPICLGLPGALPYANKEAIKKTIKLGLALGSKISEKSKFYRKHYFYPDLPKGYQISQKDNPFCVGGSLMSKKINHIHLEEDAGKLIHSGDESLIDFNRSGCALIEIVTEPVFNNVSEVLSFVKELQLIARYLDISNADMEKGTMRLEANISLKALLGGGRMDSREVGNLPDYKVELKNINSFKFLEKALKAEIERQTKALDNSEKLKQETRGYDEKTKTTFSQRTKTDSDDYRYFPEPDISPINSTEYIVHSTKIPELPQAKRDRFMDMYKLPKDYVEILISDLERANYFEQAVKLAPDLTKSIADLMINKNMDNEYPEPAGFVKKIVELTKIEYASTSDLEQAIKDVLFENPNIVDSYINGKGQVIGFLIGQVQKVLQGKGDPKMINVKLIESLQKNI